MYRLLVMVNAKKAFWGLWGTELSELVTSLASRKELLVYLMDWTRTFE